MIGDIADAVSRANLPGGQGFVTHGLYGEPLDPDESMSKYYLRVKIQDKPGSLAQIATILGEHGIGILSVIQPEDHDEETAPVALTLHFAPFGENAGGGEENFGPGQRR